MLKGYLAGPIENCTLANACDWRTKIQKQFQGLIKFHNPMCGKEQIVSGKKLIKQANYAPESRLLTKPDSIFYRDLTMIRDSDFLLVNSLTGTRFSKGTMFEVGYAYATNKMIILIGRDPELVDHPFIKCSSVVFDTLTDSFEFMTTLAEDFRG
jgi:nucleoside 2-deoxyribosyltransferase